MPPPPAVDGEKHIFVYTFRSSVRPLSVNTYCAWRDICVLSGGISINLGTNIYHVSWHCWKGFQGQRSKVKVISRVHTFRLYGV